MDVEKTMEFILASQARLQARFEAGEDQAKAEMAEIRLTLKQTTFIQQEQARILVRIEKNVEEVSQAQKELTTAQKELAAAQKDLAASQEITEATLKAFIDSLRRGGNGTNGGNH